MSKRYASRLLTMPYKAPVFDQHDHNGNHIFLLRRDSPKILREVEMEADSNRKGSLFRRNYSGPISACLLPQDPSWIFKEVFTQSPAETV